jgi:type II secretory pathway pseudopilin PulG
MAFIRGFLDRIILVVGIIAAGCIPGFIAQYRQRLGGRLDQVMQDIAPFQEIANQLHHGSLQELIQHHLSSVDRTFHDEGAALQAMIDSAARLRAAYQALNTDLLHQLLYLASGGSDIQIVHSTWQVFVPAFALTMESVVFAACIGVAIWLFFLTVWLFFARLFPRFTS